MHRLFGKVVRQDRDIVGIVSDARGRRGTGKTVTAMKLADAMDQTEEGLTYGKCTLRPEELRNAYSNQPKRSGLVLDEGEVGIDNRSAMTKTNKAIREIISMGRIQQKYLWINVPIKSFIDKDILKLCDVWIKIEHRGRGLVHHLKWEPYSETLHTEKKQWLTFDDIPKGTDLRQAYNKLTRDKQGHIDGDEGDTYIPKEKHEKEIQKVRDQAKKDQRNEDIRGFYKHEEIRDKNVPQRVVGEAVGVSQGTVAKVLEDREDTE